MSVQVAFQLSTSLSEAARLGMGEETQAKTLPPAHRQDALADPGEGAALQVFNQGWNFFSVIP